MTDIDELKSKINDFIASHHLRHENNDLDEIDLTGLSGLLADDQHVLDAEVLAVAAALSHKDTHDPNDGSDPLDTDNASEIAGVQAAGTGTSHSLARADHVHAINHGITDNHLITIDSADVADDEYARFTANGLESRSATEVRSDINVADGADVTGDNAPQAHKDSHDPNDGSDPLDTASAAEISVVVAAGTGTSHSLARADHVHAINHAITDNHLVTVDGTVVDGQRAYWNADGLQGFADVGSTFPSPAQDGMTFCHEVTGRKILYVYDADNTTWKPIISIGAMTLYVDKTDGSDSLEDHGTGVDGDAFATVQYAVDCIPGLVGGNVTININGEQYSEDIIIRGKNKTGNYAVTLQGTLSENTSGTQSANGLQGAAANHGYFTDAGNLAGIANMLAYLDADGDYRIIDSTDGDDATVTGYFTSQPLQNENYVVYDWGTRIRSITNDNGNTVVYANDIYFYNDNAGYANSLSPDTQTTYTRCKFSDSGIAVVSATNGHSTYTRCLFITSDAAYLHYTLNQAYNGFVGCKFVSSLNTGIIHYLGQGSQIYFTSQPSVIEGDAGGGNRANYGVYSTGACFISFGNLYNKIRNCDTGLYASGGTTIMYTVNNQYTNCGTNESAVAADFSYID